MLSFKSYLEERWVNLIGDHPDKHKYAQHVYDLVQHAYKDQGGIHGSGFKSPEDMMKNIHMWKLYRDASGNIRSAGFYKNSDDGRKRVAIATDGSDEGKKAAARIMTDDINRNRSYGEQSGKSLSFLKKNLPDGHLKKIAMTHDQVKKMMPNDEITRPPADDPEVLRHPELKDHFYQRQIGGHKHTKIMLGTPGKIIS
jgi:hypothetical protein